MRGEKTIFRALGVWDGVVIREYQQFCTEPARQHRVAERILEAGAVLFRFDQSTGAGVPRLLRAQAGVHAGDKSPDGSRTTSTMAAARCGDGHLSGG